MARTGTNRDYRLRNAKLEHTLSHWTAQASTRIIELENRCTGNRTVGSNPTLSAILSAIVLNYNIFSSPEDLRHKSRPKYSGARSRQLRQGNSTGVCRSVRVWRLSISIREKLLKPFAVGTPRVHPHFKADWRSNPNSPLMPSIQPGLGCPQRPGFLYRGVGFGRNWTKLLAYLKKIAVDQLPKRHHLAEPSRYFAAWPLHPRRSCVPFQRGFFLNGRMWMITMLLIITIVVVGSAISGWGQASTG